MLRKTALSALVGTGLILLLSPAGVWAYGGGGHGGGGGHFGGGGAHFGGGGAHFGGGGAHFGGGGFGGAHFGGGSFGGAHFGGMHYGGAHFGGIHYGGAHFGGSSFGGVHYGGLSSFGHVGAPSFHSAPHVYSGSSFSRAPAYRSYAPGYHSYAPGYHSYAPGYHSYAPAYHSSLNRASIPWYHGSTTLGSSGRWAGAGTRYGTRGTTPNNMGISNSVGRVGQRSNSNVLHQGPGTIARGAPIRGGSHGSNAHLGRTDPYRHELAHKGDPAFHSNWNHNFDRWNHGGWNHGGWGREGWGRRGWGDRDDFFFGAGFTPFWCFGGYPFLNFSYLPYFSGYGGYPYGGYYDYGDYGLGGYPVAAAPYYTGYNDYVPPVSYEDAVAAPYVVPSTSYLPSTSYVAPAAPAVMPDQGAVAAPDNGAVGGPETVPAPAAADNGAAAAEGSYYDDALAAFRKGDYHEAVRLGEHAAVDAPQDANLHRLMVQALLALNIYPAAALEAHAALALGPASDWTTLSGYYGDPAGFTTELRTLESYVGSHPTAPDARFLLGYEYLVMGYKPQARDQFAEALKLVPADKVAAKVLTDLGGKVGASVPSPAKPQ